MSRVQSITLPGARNMGLSPSELYAGGDSCPVQAKTYPRRDPDTDPMPQKKDNRRTAQS